MNMMTKEFRMYRNEFDNDFFFVPEEDATFEFSCSSNGYFEKAEVVVAESEEELWEKFR
jgi:hypothetical protein